MNCPLKLVFICSNLYPYNFGGAEVFNHYLMRAFSSESEVISINTKTDKTEYAVKHLKVSLPFLEVIFFPLLTALKLLGMKGNGEMHVVLTFSRSRWIYWVAYPFLRTFFGIHYSIIIHGGGLMKWKFAAPFQWLFKRADHVIGISERITQEYHDRTGLDVKFIPPLIPFHLSQDTKADCRASLQIPSDSKVLLMVGSLKKIKHPETAISALSELGKDFLQQQKIQLVFAGDGPDRSALESEAEKLGISEHVRFLGNVPREEVKHVYRTSDFYIMASDFEGTPLSMLEAMANDLPVAVSSAPGINTIVDHENNGLLFTIGNGKELAEQLKRLLTDTDLAKDLANKAKQTLTDRYDHGKMLDHYRKMWNL